MDQHSIDFYRKRGGYTYVGTDGEADYFVRNGHAYQAHEDLGGYPRPLARLDLTDRSFATHEHGWDHASALDLLPDYYAELNDVCLYPNQRRAWTLPLQQEC